MTWYINKDSRNKNDKILLGFCSLYWIFWEFCKYCQNFVENHCFGIFFVSWRFDFLGNDLCEPTGEFSSLRACFLIPTISLKAKLVIFYIFYGFNLFLFLSKSSMLWPSWFHTDLKHTRHKVGQTDTQTDRHTLLFYVYRRFHKFILL